MSGCMRPAHFVPETKRVAELLREMQAEQVPHGDRWSTSTAAPPAWSRSRTCIEELVGEIVDEYDVEDAEVERLADGGMRVDGRLAIDELNELLDSELPDGDWDTVGGLRARPARPRAEPRASRRRRRSPVHASSECRGPRASAACASREVPTGEPVDGDERVVT